MYQLTESPPRQCTSPISSTMHCGKTLFWFVAGRLPLSIFGIITLMIIENWALWLARSFASSRYNHRAVIITLKASSFQNGSQICWCFGVGNWSIQRKWCSSKNKRCYKVWSQSTQRQIDKISLLQVTQFYWKLVQLNLSNTDTEWTGQGVRIREVSV